MPDGFVRRNVVDVHTGVVHRWTLSDTSDLLCRARPDTTMFNTYKTVTCGRCLELLGPDA